MVFREADVSADGDSNGPSSLHAEETAARARLIAAIIGAMEARGLSQVHAAKLCGTDQPTLSKVLRGRTQSVTLDKLLRWLLALGRSVEIRITWSDPARKGKLTAVVDD